MKIPHSVSRFYNAVLPRYERLKTDVDRVVNDVVKRSEWHYLSRIKSEESFYVKAQGSRWDALPEDIFACTIVVPNLDGVHDAVKVLSTMFDLDHKRPADENMTHKSPEQFAFDDLRLYLKWKHGAGSEVRGLLFECQVKTFLQHAWSIATHDLIYKAKDSSAWAAARVAFEVKAMLEHAEVAISTVEAMAQSPLLKKSDRHFAQRNLIVGTLREMNVDLGNNPFRVADNIILLLRAFDCEWSEVLNWLKKETTKGEGHGVGQLRFSIYETVIDVVLSYNARAIDSYKKQMERGRMTKIGKLFVSEELLDCHPELDSISSTLDKELE